MMKTAADILHEHTLRPTSTVPGRYMTTCPQCSANRTKRHQRSACLGITIDDKGVMWGCNHCGWTGGEYYYNGEANGHDRGTPFIAIYDYTDENGELLFQVCRKSDKTFPQRKPDGKGGWTWKTGDVRKVLYRLPDLLGAMANEHVIVVVEGEKDVDNLWKIGVPATCNPGGAAGPGQKPKWKPEYSEALRGADVVIIPDHDEPGQAHAEAIAQMSAGIVSRVRVLELAKHWPECPKGGDVSDWLAAGHSREQLDALIERASDWAPQSTDQEASSKQARRNKDKPAGLEDAVALRFAELHADDLRFVAMWNRWMQYDDTRWLAEDTLRAFDEARTLCRQAGNAKAKTVAAVVTLARSDRRLAAITDQWDADIWLFGTPAGTIDLQTGNMRAASPTDYITKITTVRPGGDCPLWRKFLARITGNDAGLQEYLQRVSGYSLTGDTSEDALFFLYGTGANGKSVFIKTIAGILGDHHKTASMETFTVSNNDRHPTDLADLRGARLVTAVETEEGKRWDEAKIKALTGGDRIKARFMRQDFFEYTPRFKLLIAGNHRPAIRSVDEAIRRRMNLIPFTVTIPPEERDLDLADKLRVEWPGILAWMIEGCLAWQRDGLCPPAAVTTATENYLEAEDAIRNWIDECCEVGPNFSDSIGWLWNGWKDWAEKAGEYVGSKRKFGQKLEEKGFIRTRDMRARRHLGIRFIGVSGGA